MGDSHVWSAAQIPNLAGKTAVITGGNKGLGFQSALALAKSGAKVVISARDEISGNAAKSRIKQQVTETQVEVIPLDLTSDVSINKFSALVKTKYQCVDLLICNAGVVNLSARQLTPRGFELHMATNHFGHYALTALLLPLITAAENARVVVVSSLAYKRADLNFNDLHWQQRKYHTVQSYGDSKLANLLFVNGLNKFFKNQGCSAIAVSAHPGLTATERQQSIGIGGRLARWLASPVEKGVLPQLMAAVYPGLSGGEFFGPRWGVLGKPVKLAPPRLNDDETNKLWQLSAEATGVNFE